MSCKDKEIHDTLIMARMLPKTISMEDCMKLLRTLKAEMEIQHYKEMQGMLSIEEAKEVFDNGFHAGMDYRERFYYLSSFVYKGEYPNEFQEWDNRALSAIDKKKQASQTDKK